MDVPAGPGTSGRGTAAPGTAGRGDADTTVFRPSPAGAVLDLGRSAAVTGVLAVAFAVVAVLTGAWPRTVLLVVVVIGVAVTLALGVRVLLRLTGRGPRLELDADGWTNTTGRAPRRVAWTDVSELSSVTAGGRLLLVAQLRGGGTSTVLVRRLGTPPTVIEEAVRVRLNNAFGYTPFR